MYAFFTYTALAGVRSKFLFIHGPCYEKINNWHGHKASILVIQSI